MIKGLREEDLEVVVRINRMYAFRNKDFCQHYL